MLSSQSQEAHAKVGNVLKILPGSVKWGSPFGWILFNFHGLVVAESNDLLLKKKLFGQSSRYTLKGPMIKSALIKIYIKPLKLKAFHTRINYM